MADLSTRNVHELSDQLSAVLITQNYAKLWLSGLNPDAKAQLVEAADAKDRYMHVRQAQHHRGHDSEHEDPAFFEEIAQAIAKSPQVLLVGHGKGKANAAAKFVDYLEKKHPNLSGNVAGMIDTNIQAMTDPEILELSRDWFIHHIDSGI
ncbi:MAG TPA: hypothetical protein VMV52_06475 [Candidatus Nanopelagicaceae bacterium]|nr:hypothetical protein [Candidatus Nanopelagicaceae bacterium]